MKTMLMVVMYQLIAAASLTSRRLSDI